MIRNLGGMALLLGCVLMVAGCGSARFGGAGPQIASTRPTPARAPEPVEPITEAMPAGPVTSEPLPPLAGAPSVTGSGPNVAVADVPIMPGSPGPVQEMRPAASATPRQVANASPSRSSNVGAWNAREATGTNCRVQLSSSPALDLYKASASGCANKDLAKITAWDFREGEVYLYQQGGTVAARLRSAGSSLEGVLAKSGAPLTLVR